MKFNKAEAFLLSILLKLNGIGLFKDYCFLMLAFWSDVCTLN